MSEDTTSSPEDNVPQPPPGEFVSPQQRKRRTLRGTLVMLVVLAVGLFMMWKLFFSGNDGQLTLDGQQINSPGGTQIEGDVNEGGAGGGMRQELVQVQADIEAEEQRRQQIASGRTSIQLGETDLILDEELEEEPPVETNSTFGMIAPEPEPVYQPSSNNVIQPGRRAVTMSRNQAGGVAAGNPGNAGILEEMERIEEANSSGEGWNSTVDYAEATDDAGGQLSGRSRMPITPGLEDRYYGGSGNRNTTNVEIGGLAMPGDTLLAYMENRISSDQPNARVVAHILDGELKGGRAIGQATFEGERLIVEFNRAVSKDGVLYDGISMLAVDPRTLETSLQSGINRKLFLRYGVPILYGVAGLGIEYAAERDQNAVIVEDLETGTTTRRSTSNTDSFGQFAGQQIAQDINRPLSDAASRAASAKPVAWADPGIIGLAVDTPIPSK